MNKNEEFKNAVYDNNYEKTKNLINEIDIDYFQGEHNFILIDCVSHGFYEIVELLISNHNFDPSDMHNWAIHIAYKDVKNDFMNLLWNDKRVRKTLKEDNLEIYHFMKKIYCQNNILDF